MAFLQEIQKTAARVEKQKGLAKLAQTVNALAGRLGEVALSIGKTAMSPDFKIAFAHSVPFLEVMGDTVMAWMLLWRAGIAAKALENGARKKDVAFYEGQIKSAEFFINTEIPVTLGRMNSIDAASSAAVDISEAAFGG